MMEKLSPAQSSHSETMPQEWPIQGSHCTQVCVYVCVCVRMHTLAHTLKQMGV